MLRLHFTAEDRGRVRLARELDPLWEVCLGAQALRAATPPRSARAWRAEVRSRVDHRMRPLFELVPAGGGFPDFLTPALAGGAARARVEALLDVPTSTIRAELHGPRMLSPWSTRLSRGDAVARRELGAAVLAFHNAALAPTQGLREQWLGADRGEWAARAADDGVDALLHGLMPRMTWEAPYLTYLTAGAPAAVVEVDLAGRGLVIYPSRLVSEPLVLDVLGQEPVLVVPGAVETIDREGELSHLIGRTRACVLAALRSSASTTELARRAGISVASASEHASVLRGAGLIATHRDARSVRHSLTSLGHRLLVESGTSSGRVAAPGQRTG